MKIVATTIGTRVYYGFETTAGVRPTALSEYTLLEDCTSHPDFNPEREQIETTTLIQENNKTYTYGLRDFGTLEFGFNLTQDILDEFLTPTTGILDLYKTNMAEGKRLWLVVDIKNVNKSFFIPVEPMDFGLPEGATNSKYELTIRFTAQGDGIWADDLIDDTPQPEPEPTPTPTTYTITNTLTNATSSNEATTIEENSAYSATITTDEGYIFGDPAITITMGGEDITSTVWTLDNESPTSTGTISIASVTGNVVITCEATSNL